MWSADKKLACLYRSAQTSVENDFVDMDKFISFFKEDREQITLTFIYKDEEHSINFQTANLSIQRIVTELKNKFKTLPKFFSLRYNNSKIDNLILHLLDDNSVINIKEKTKVKLQFPDKAELFFVVDPEDEVKALTKHIRRRRLDNHTLFTISYEGDRCDDKTFNDIIEDDDDIILLDVEYQPQHSQPQQSGNDLGNAIVLD